MKASGNLIGRLIVGCVLACCFASFTPQARAIEDLKISVAVSNVVLSWPSAETEFYIVQYRPSLTDTNGWQTLATSWPADSGTNLTCFIHTNAVQNPVGGGSYMAMASGGGLSSLSSATATLLPLMPLAIPTNGLGSAVPLALYPPGVDLSKFLIYDPVTDLLCSSAEYTASSSSRLQTTEAGLDGGFFPTPMENSSGTLAEPETGFYRVVRNGAHLWGMTNGMVLSDVVRIPIELGLGTTDEVAGVTFYANGSPLIGASAEGEGYAWTLNWDTKMMPNGTYDLTAEVSFTTQDESTNTTAISVTVDNAISFPNYFSRIYGSQMWIYAELASPVADYTLDLYDENTNYLGYFGGTTSDGVISFIWDLTDGNGYTFESTNFFGVFTVTPSTMANGPTPMGGSSPSTAMQTWTTGKSWHWQDNFAIAYAPLNTFGTTTEKINNMVSMGVVDILDGTYVINPENKPLAMTAFGILNGADKTNLLEHLADPAYRNLYFYGHGSPAGFGGIGGRDTIITDLELKHRLNNFLTSAKPANYHPYRFVFIEGCEVGKGNFCEVFGIPAQTVNDAFFAASGLRSRAFLGYTTKGSFNPNDWMFRANMLAEFWANWAMYGYTLQTCVNEAVNFGTGAMDSSWVIYGATDLRRNSQ